VNLLAGVHVEHRGDETAQVELGEHAGSAGPAEGGAPARRDEQLPTASASATGSPGATRYPVCPCTTVSVMPPVRAGTTGRPMLIASTGTRPNGSRPPGSKHHILTEGAGIPLCASLTGGNHNDVTVLLPLIDSDRAGRRPRPDRDISQAAQVAVD
jgi:hypothetical protein